MSDYAYMKRWQHERSKGLLRQTDAGPARRHVQALLDEGWSLRGIADAAGVTAAVPYSITRLGQERMRKDTAAKVLAVTRESLEARQLETGFVLKHGAVRRVQALLAIGHRHEDITAAMVRANPAVGTRSQMVLHQRGVWVARTTRDAVCQAYETLSTTPGPSAKTRRLAAKYGYAPPLAWDDTAIDDPDGTPNLGDVDTELDEVAVQRLLQGTLPAQGNTPERTEAIRRLACQGLSDSEIGNRIGITHAAVLKVRKRNAIPTGVPVSRSA